MLGLLDKARKLRDTLGLGTDGREEFAFDPDSGISREEQKEIRQEIEKVAAHITRFSLYAIRDIAAENEGERA